MRIHGNAALTQKQRERLARRVLDEGWTITSAAMAAEVSRQTAGKWVARFRKKGVEGLTDRSSAPANVHNRTAEGEVEVIEALRRLRFTGPEIAELLGMASSTVSAVLKRIGLGKLYRLGPKEEIRRYEKARPGELIHIDVKKLGRIGRKGPGHRVLGRGKNRTSIGAGWECVHIAIDDCSRLAYAEVLADEKALTAIGFLKRALAFYRSFGVEVERLMTDNGSAYKSSVHAIACRKLGIKHSRTRPYRPQTNGKAERFIRTMLKEWAYAVVYGSSSERAGALSPWIERYNFRRRHSALGKRPPIERVQERTGNNLLGSYS
jgi:transposase InsO family protein